MSRIDPTFASDQPVFGPRGAHVRYQRLGEKDRAQILQHMMRLEPEDRRQRFCGPAGAAFIQGYCRRLDLTRADVIGCFIDGVLRAVGELKPEPSDGYKTAEITSSVEKPYRRQGIGSELFRRLTASARARGIDTVHMVSLRENEAAQRVARRFGAHLIFQRGEVTGIVESRHAGRPEADGGT